MAFLECKAGAEVLGPDSVRDPDASAGWRLPADTWKARPESSALEMHMMSAEVLDAYHPRLRCSAGPTVQTCHVTSLHMLLRTV